MAHLLWPAELQADAIVRTLSDPGSRDRFLAFCQQEHNSEGAWFALAVAQYRASPYWAEADAIYDIFIPQESTLQVNIAGETRRRVEWKFRHLNSKLPPPQDLFDEALTEAVRILGNDTYRRFKSDSGVGLEGNFVKRHIKGSQREKYAKALLAQHDAQLRQAVQGKKTGWIAAQTEEEERALLKKELRAASFDLSVMGLA